MCCQVKRKGEIKIKRERAGEIDRHYTYLFLETACSKCILNCYPVKRHHQRQREINRAKRGIKRPKKESEGVEERLVDTDKEGEKNEIRYIER